MRLAARMLPDGRRLHLSDGPIDLIIEAWGSADARRAAYRGGGCAVRRAFSTRSAPSCRCCATAMRGAAAPRAGRWRGGCRHAVRPYAAEWFITPMAAVAGAVAEEVLAAMTRRGAARPRLCQQWRRHRAPSRA